MKGVRIIPANADDFATVVSECGCHFVAFIWRGVSIGEVTRERSQFEKNAT